MNRLIKRGIYHTCYSKICPLLRIVKIHHTVNFTIAIFFMILIIHSNPALCQFPVIPPVSYYYTNPLYFSDYGYINSITDPFYYLGYGYKPPIEGDTLLGWNRFNPFLDAYSVYLYNFLGIPTYGYVNSPYQSVFPFRTLPGTGYPYERFVYPTYTYGSPEFYQNWVDIQ
ncbi:hypothetical protein JXL19_07045 [bacterium]|nr:hypothetical protein [bacterium]